MSAVTSSFLNPKTELMAIPGEQVLYGRASWYKTLGLSVCQEVGRNMKRERGYSLVAYHLCVFRGLNTHREGIYLDWYKVLFANTIFYFLQYCELGEQTKMDKIKQIKYALKAHTDPIFWFVNWRILKTAHHNIPRVPVISTTSTSWCWCACFLQFLYTWLSLGESMGVGASV